MHILKKASVQKRARGSRPRRRGAVVGTIVALSGLGGAVPAFGGFTPDPVPRAYAGRYVLFYNNEFAGPVRSVSGCAADITLAEHKASSGELKTMAQGFKMAPCVIDVGLNMSERFRSAVVSELSAQPVDADWAIGHLNAQGSAVVSELQLRGYISDVTLPTLHRQPASDPSWIRVELIDSDARVRTVTNPRRTVGSLEDDPIEAAQPMIALNVTDVVRNLVAADPVELIRADVETEVLEEGGTKTSRVVPEGALKAPQARLRVAEAPRAVNALTTWFDQTTLGTLAKTALTLTYPSVSGAYRFDVSMTVLPTHFDPFPRTDNRRLLAVAGDRAVTARWGPPSAQ